MEEMAFVCSISLPASPYSLLLRGRVFINYSSSLSRGGGPLAVEEIVFMFPAPLRSYAALRDSLGEINLGA